MQQKEKSKVKSSPFTQEQIAKANRLFCKLKNIRLVATAMGMSYETFRTSMLLSEHGCVTQLLPNDVIEQASDLEATT